MGRYRSYTQRDDEARAAGDLQFLGMNNKIAPELLPAGMVRYAQNKRFRDGRAATREGTLTPVSHRLGNIPGTAARTFDFAVVRYEWGPANGTDLDTRTAILAPEFDLSDTGTQAECGWSRNMTKFPASAAVPYLQWGGDDTGSYGPEATLINFQQLAADYPAVPVLVIRLRAFWFRASLGAGGDARASVTLELYRGGTMAAAGHDFVNAGGVLVSRMTRTVALTTDNVGHDIDGEDIGTIRYTTATRKAELEFATIVTGDGSADAGTPDRTPAAVWGSGIFSDPAGQEWLLVATDIGVYQLRDGHTPRFVEIPETLDGPVAFVQAFNQVILFRGEGADQAPWEWDGTRTGAFTSISQDARTDGTEPIPSAATAELMGNRLLVPTGRDHIAVSDILDYTRYDPAAADFNVNSGSDDSLVRIYPFTATSLLVFKDQSIFLISNLYGDLSAVRLDQINREIGCAAARSVALVGGDVFFLSATGVFRIQQIIQQRLQTAAVAVSDPIEPLIRRRINWRAAGNAAAAVHGEYYYLAVPLDGSPANNAVLPYNTVTQAWEGVHTWPAGVQFDALHVTDWNGVKRLWAVDNAHRRVHLLYEGFTDLIADAEHQIPDRLDTRGLLLESNGIKQIRAAQVNVETWNPSFSVELVTDGVNERAVLASAVTKDPARSYVFGAPAHDPGNAGDDHAAPCREDYSVSLSVPLHLGSHGVDFNLLQASTERYPCRARARFAGLRITNTRGVCAVTGVSLEGSETDRSERTQRP